MPERVVPRVGESGGFTQIELEHEKTVALRVRNGQ